MSVFAGLDWVTLESVSMPPLSEDLTLFSTANQEVVLGLPR